LPSPISSAKITPKPFKRLLTAHSKPLF